MTVSGLVLDAVKVVFGAFAGAVIVKRVQGKARLVSFWGHASEFTVSNPGQPPFVIRTHDVVIRNAGAKAANNVRVSHAVPLPQFNVSPSIPYTVQTLPSGHQDIVIPTLVPKQQIVISYLYNPPLTFNQINAGIRSDEGFATPVEMELQQKPAAWLMALGIAGFLIGCLTVLYLLWRGLQHF